MYYNVYIPWCFKNNKTNQLDKEDIDLIVVATSSPEQTSPSTACTIHKKLGIKKDIANRFYEIVLGPFCLISCTK